MPDRHWLPTSAAQSVLVYALNVLLLLNLTVIVVLLSDQPAVPAQRAQTSPTVTGGIPADADQSVQADQPEQATVFVADTSEAEPLPPIHLPDASVLLVDPAIERGVSPIQQTHVAQPQDDPPVTFFGVGIE